MDRISSINVLSPEDVLARMQDLVARARTLHEQSQASPGARLDTLSGAGRGFNVEQSGVSDGQRLDFHEVLKDAVRGVSDAQQAAQSKAQAYQLGDDKVSLEDVMISIQKASLAMQGMVQVRNRLVESYREVMNLQV
jgi:flagellar hook-basal body complex protein FliE